MTQLSRRTVVKGMAATGALAANSITTWRHAGYIMVLYLAGLKSLDPSLRDAAVVDGANEWQTFR